MDCNYLEKISLLVDDKLSAPETAEVKNHLAVCAECQAAEASFLALRRQIKAIRIPRDLIAEREVLNEILQNGKSKPAKTAGKFAFLRPALAAAMVLLVAVVGILIYNRLPQKSWDVARLEGTPQLATRSLNGNGRLRIGEWLVTDEASRAQIVVADIGKVEVEPESKIRLVETNQTEHRLELQRGSITAQINAPPRLFFVNTPSATVIDYGCAYSLSVDEEGASVLHVTEGWVSLALNGRESLVPASAYAKSRRGVGPGTPYFEDASGEFMDALTSFDFENGGSAAIDTILKESRGRDALSLWYLLERSSETDRAHIFDRLAAFVQLPTGATREGVLSLNRGMLDAWKETIDVLSVGGYFDSKNQTSGSSSRLISVGNMNAPRAGHTATKLFDGRVLIVGGMQKEGLVLPSAEIYDPQTKTFSPARKMSVGRTGHTATLLPNGDVLIAGGRDEKGIAQASAEIYHPATGVFSVIGNLNFARANHQATLLEGGKILITGGADSNRSAISSTEIYDAEKRVFTSAGNMNAAREFHSATLLADGNVLISGGKTGEPPSAAATLSGVELYYFSTGKFVSIGNMTERRYSHAATRLSDGRVLITGGSTGREWKDRTRGAEVYDPRSKAFSSVGEMSLPRFNHQAATLPLSDGRVLIAGAGARLEVFDPVTGSFGSTAGNVGTGRIFSTATLLQNGEILIIGGYNFDYPPTSNAWLYQP